MPVVLKYLLLAALAAILWWAWGKSRRPRPAAPPRREIPPEKMVACARCGVHLPESDALAANGRFYCSEDHRPSIPPSAAP